MSEPLNQILERVRTFKIAYWPYHNIKITPYQIASIGYTAVGLNLLQCSTCHLQVFVKQERYDQLQQDLLNHQENCIYKGQNMHKISKEQLYLKMDDFHHQLKSSYAKKQEGLKISYPILNYKAFLEYIGPHKHTLYKILHKYKVNDKQISISFILQFMGWRMLSEEINKGLPQKLECLFCGRVLKIKNFQTTQNDKQQRNSNDQENQNDKFFDPTDQHRYFCLWTSNIKGWELYLQHLWDKIGQSQSLFKRDHPSQTKKMRVMLDGYLQNFQIRTRQIFEKINNVMDQCKTISTFLQGQAGRDLKQKAETNKLALNQFYQQIQENVRKPLKKIKLS